MARPKSKDKRAAILEAATRVIVTKGLSAPTAVIAKKAGVANGTLFTYFATKAELFNELYLDLKTAMAAAALKDFPERAKLRKQAFHVWLNWTRWAAANPDKRRALALLAVSEEIKESSHIAGQKIMAGLFALIERVQAGGSLRKAPEKFVLEIMNGIAEATMGSMIADPSGADVHCKNGFEAFWRVFN